MKKKKKKIQSIKQKWIYFGRIRGDIRMYYLYKYLDKNTEECLYVGQTKNLYTRHLDHLCNKKEDWCNNLVIMKYVEVPDRYNLNFLEMYLINKEMPKYNISGKDKMDLNFIKIEFSPEWKIYKKEDFLKDANEKGRKLGIDYKVSIKNKNTLKSLLQEKDFKGANYTESGVDVSFEVDCKTFESISENFLLDVSFCGLEIRGFGALIRINRSYRKDRDGNFISGTLDFNLDINFLKSIIDSVFEPTKELDEILDIVNEFLKMIGINKNWKEILELKRKK